MENTVFPPVSRARSTRTRLQARVVATCGDIGAGLRGNSTLIDRLTFSTFSSSWVNSAAAIRREATPRHKSVIFVVMHRPTPS